VDEKKEKILHAQGEGVVEKAQITFWFGFAVSFVFLGNECGFQHCAHSSGRAANVFRHNQYQ
jgi:hypothetical protein